MAIEVIMPKVGLTMTEGTIREWKKQEGDWVEKGEILFVFETEKVTIDVEAPESGFLAKILAREDEVVPVGQPVGLLVKEKGEQVDVTGEMPEAPPRSEEQGAANHGMEATGGIKATPMARKIAKVRGIDLRRVSGSGPGGRIRASDVEAQLEASADEPVPSRAAEGRLVKLSGMRSIIARKMLASKTETAQTYMTISVDAARIVEARDRLAPIVGETAGVHLTITDLLMKIAASAISRHPIINTKWTEEGILWLDAVHMGMAMALEEGLIVPVIWDIVGKSLSETAKSRAEIVAKGKAGMLTPDDMKGSTFTLSSLGMFGVEEFTANINQPESAILAVGTIMDTPVAVNKQVVIRPVMKLTLSYDHRVIDGAKAAQFMKTLREFMEEPILILS
ncbi:MAG: dihydrolipoamide acetyltransferase family protein [Desulfomonilaceae bacterium]|nr:dihydrolipoamide acetyltransferase family protein [Desulfomonilaceae bacterium]